jgi:hypothetical protein
MGGEHRVVLAYSSPLTPVQVCHAGAGARVLAGASHGSSGKRSAAPAHPGRP